jgi:hypothetical protein
VSRWRWSLRAHCASDQRELRLRSLTGKRDHVLVAPLQLHCESQAPERGGEFLAYPAVALAVRERGGAERPALRPNCSADEGRD